MYNTRNIIPSDYQFIIGVLDQWWGGRNMSHMLPKLFFEHFSDTSFIIHIDEDVAGFIIGFISPKKPETAYVHFVGVNPEHRTQGIGRKLYDLFTSAVKELGARHIECVTSPSNTLSINFHKKLGFIPQKGDSISKDQTPYTANYDGPGEDRVVFKRSI